MASLTDLTYTNNMSAAKRPFLTDLEAALDSIQTYINDTIKDNLVQLSLDALGSAYAFDSDGLAQYTNNLYNKLYVKDSYTGGDYTVSTTGAWTDVDATNASVAITPELAGDFVTTFQFSVSSVTSNATNETDIRFRLTDGSTASTCTPRIKLVTGVSGSTNEQPVVVKFTHEDLAASSQTIKLQYYITTSTASTIKVLANSNDPLYMESQKA